MSEALQQLLDAVATLANEERVLELAVRAMYDACGRGLALGITSRGARSERMGSVRMCLEGEPVEMAPSHLAYVRTSSYDVTDVPVAQRNRWLEPFREGLATPEGLKKSSIWPFVARFGMLDFGRITVCAGARQVALVALTIPEGTSFSDDERARLAATAEALVVPLRVAAIVADASAAQSALQRMLDAHDDAVVALDDRGEILDASRAAFELLRADRALPERLRAAVRGLSRTVLVVRSGAQVIHLTRCTGESAYLAAIDGAGFVEPPVELSERQRELLVHLERGLTNAQIGTAMEIAPSTVKTMLERLYERANVANRVELLAWARRLGGG
jgi:DNA-binding NarL/FixJ family response regulator